MSRKWFITATGAALLAASLLAGVRDERAGQAPAGCGTDHPRLLAGRLGERLAHREHEVGPVLREDGRHQPQVLGRPAEAGEPDPGDPLLHPAARERDRVLAGRRERLGRSAQRGQARRDPGDPHRPRGRLEGHVPLQDLHRLRLHQGRKIGRAVGGEHLQEREVRREDRGAPGHDRLGARHRPRGGLPCGDQGQPAPEDRRLADRRVHPRQGQGGHGGVPEGEQEDRRAVRAQRRHGPRRDRGDRGGRAEAGQGHQDRHHRRRPRRDGRPVPGEDQLHRRVQPAARPAAHAPRQAGRGGQDHPEADRHARRRRSPRPRPRWLSRAGSTRSGPRRRPGAAPPPPAGVVELRKRR